MNINPLQLIVKRLMDIVFGIIGSLVTLILTIVWLVIIVGWYLLGFKIGVNTYPTI